MKGYEVEVQVHLVGKPQNEMYLSYTVLVARVYTLRIVYEL